MDKDPPLLWLCRVEKIGRKNFKNQQVFVMKNDKLVSVLICVYNGKDHLREAINSILSQDYKNIEIVIVDDGSTDNTEQIAKSYTDKRLKYYKNETNLGLTRSLNIGLKHCSGRYVCRIDHDDFCLPGRIRKQVALLESEGYVLTGGWARVVDENGAPLRSLKPVTDSDLIHFRLCFSNVFIHSATLFLRRRHFRWEVIMSLSPFRRTMIYGAD